MPEAQKLQQGLEYAIKELEETSRMAKNQDMLTNIA